MWLAGEVPGVFAKLIRPEGIADSFIQSSIGHLGNWFSYNFSGRFTSLVQELDSKNQQSPREPHWAETTRISLDLGCLLGSQHSVTIQWLTISAYELHPQAPGRTNVTTVPRGMDSSTAFIIGQGFFQAQWTWWTVSVLRGKTWQETSRTRTTMVFLPFCS